MNQQEVLELARTFRTKQIPCDVIYLDIHYMDEYRVFTFDPVRFPDPEGMMEELKSLGIRIIPIVDPGVKKDPKYTVYQEGVRENHFIKKLEGDIFLGEVWPGISAFRFHGGSHIGMVGSSIVIIQILVFKVYGTI